MKIIHLMVGKEKFTQTVADLYNESFNNGEHEICYLMEEGQSTCIREEISIPQYEVYKGKGIFEEIKYSMRLVSFIRKYDYIVLHSLCIDRWTILYLFAKRNYCRNHVVWIEWGADLYDFKLESDANVIKKFFFLARKAVRKNVNSMIGIFPPDCDFYKSHYPKSRANVYYAPYIGRRDNNTLPVRYTTESRLEKTLKNDEPVYIQIGHNGQKQLNHLKTLEIMSQFRDEKIMLVLPLSYCGDKDYVDQIYRYLEEFFPDKYIVLKDFIPREEYFRLVDRIDIGIFYTYRQTGLSNIHHMIRNNVKLFMPEGSVMKGFFCSVGIPVAAIESINEMGFDRFVSTIQWDQIDGPKKYIDFLDDYDARLGLWKNIYHQLRKDNE